MNPKKAEKKLELTTHHRIVCVVYIPNEEGFYQHSLEVFKLCLDSLVSTVNNRGAITIVNNGSHQKVSVLLAEYLASGKIDTVISHKTNIGKIDALIGAARGVREPIITLADADVLFVAGWQENVEKVFLNFPNAGSVSPLPVKNGIYYFTSSTLKQIVLRRLKFKYTLIPENGEAYNRYLSSINWEKQERPEEDWPVVDHRGFKAILGSGHQVLAIRRELLFDSIPMSPSLTLIGGSSEVDYVDFPITIAGKLRLSTYFNFAFHMGNKVDDWMTAVQRNNEQAARVEAAKSDFRPAELLHSKIRQKYRALERIVFSRIFRSVYDRP